MGEYAKLRFEPGQKKAEVHEFLGVGSDGKFRAGVLMEADDRGIRFESESPRWMNPSQARALASWLRRLADFAEERGCPADAMMP